MPSEELGFEMIWLEEMQNLFVFFTGNFDTLLYVDPFSGKAATAVFNLAAYKGSDGNLEFEVPEIADAALIIRFGHCVHACMLVFCLRAIERLFK